MVFVSYKNRSSDNYRFSCDTHRCIEIQDLKRMIRNENKTINRFNKSLGFRKYNTKGLRIRPRGPRDGDTHDTPFKNATHFDVYIREYY